MVEDSPSAGTRVSGSTSLTARLARSALVQVEPALRLRKCLFLFEAKIDLFPESRLSRNKVVLFQYFFPKTGLHFRNSLLPSFPAHVPFYLCGVWISEF